MNRRKCSWIGAMLALLLYAVPSLAQTSETPPEPPKAESEVSEKEPEEPKEESQELGEEAEKSKSGYSDTVDAGGGGSKSVSAELVDRDRVFDSIFRTNLMSTLGSDYYRFKKSLNERTGIAYNVDYSLLATRASYSSTDDESAASSVFRVYGAWCPSSPIQLHFQ